MGAFLAIYKLFSCASTLFYIIINTSACPDTEKGDGWPRPKLDSFKKGGGFCDDMVRILSISDVRYRTFQDFLESATLRSETHQKRKVTAPSVKSSGYFLLSN